MCLWSIFCGKTIFILLVRNRIDRDRAFLNYGYNVKIWNVKFIRHDRSSKTSARKNLIYMLSGLNLCWSQKYSIVEHMQPVSVAWNSMFMLFTHQPDISVLYVSFSLFSLLQWQIFFMFSLRCPGIWTSLITPVILVGKSEASSNI